MLNSMSINFKLRGEHVPTSSNEIQAVAKLLSVSEEQAEYLLNTTWTDRRQANLKRFEELQAKEAAMIAEQQTKRK